MINEIITEKNLQPFPATREEMIEILQREAYGYMPTEPFTLSWSEPSRKEPRMIESRYDGFAVSEVTLTVTVRGRDFSWNVKRALHTDGKKRPFFIFNNFRPDFPDIYCPVEEICDNGFDLLWFCYTDVTSDDPSRTEGDFTTGLADLFVGSKERTSDTECGKIMLWAWANMRVMDYAQTLPELDHDNGAVLGHSRLGKTALVTGLFDDRFKYIISNNAGCMGESAARVTTGETVKDITTVFPFWFCKNIKKYADHIEDMPFDQHFLLAAQYPKYLYVAGSSLDSWCDPYAQYITMCKASEFYEKNGMTGFVHPDRLPEVGESFHEGHIGYHLKSGQHFLSRRDWLQYMAFIRKHMAD